MKVGPRAGTRCNVAKNANMEKPKEEYRAGIEGAGSKKGLAMNHEATGTRPKSNTGDKGRGEIMRRSTYSDYEIGNASTKYVALLRRDQSCPSHPARMPMVSHLSTLAAVSFSWNYRKTDNP